MIAVVGGFIGSALGAAGEHSDPFVGPLMGFFFGAFCAGFFGLVLVVGANMRINEALMGGNKERERDDNY